LVVKGAGFLPAPPLLTQRKIAASLTLKNHPRVAGLHNLACSAFSKHVHGVEESKMVRSKTLAFSVPRLVLSIALMLLSVGFKPSSVSAAFKEFPSEEISSVRTSVVGSPLGRKVAIPDGLAFSARQDIVADSLVYRATEWKGIFAALKIPERITESYAEFQDLLTYKVNQLLTANVFSKLIMFFSFSAALVFFGAWLCLVTGETNWRSALFKSYALLNNAPGVSGL